MYADIDSEQRLAMCVMRKILESTHGRCSQVAKMFLSNFWIPQMILMLRRLIESEF